MDLGQLLLGRRLNKSVATSPEAEVPFGRHWPNTLRTCSDFTRKQMSIWYKIASVCVVVQCLREQSSSCPSSEASVATVKCLTLNNDYYNF